MGGVSNKVPFKVGGVSNKVPFKVGDNVIILPNKGTGVIERIVNDFIFLDIDKERPYSPHQLKLLEKLTVYDKNDIAFNSQVSPIVIFKSSPENSKLPHLYDEFMDFCNFQKRGIDGKLYKRNCIIDLVTRTITFSWDLVSEESEIKN